MELERVLPGCHSSRCQLTCNTKLRCSVTGANCHADVTSRPVWPRHELYDTQEPFTLPSSCQSVMSAPPFLVSNVRTQ